MGCIDGTYCRFCPPSSLKARPSCQLIDGVVGDFAYVPASNPRPRSPGSARPSGQSCASALRCPHLLLDEPLHRVRKLLVLRGIVAQPCPHMTSRR